jgi:hypothetical protein
MRTFVIVIGLLTFLVFPQSHVFSQEISCEELTEYIETNGWKKGTLYNHALQSSWLYEVTAYSYDMKLFVIAEIKKSEYSYSTNTYIFCGVPQYNWSQFQFQSFKTYGEKFHDYIFPYKCNCY